MNIQFKKISLFGFQNKIILIQILIMSIPNFLFSNKGNDLNSYEGMTIKNIYFKSLSHNLYYYFIIFLCLSIMNYFLFIYLFNFVKNLKIIKNYIIKYFIFIFTSIILGYILTIATAIFLQIAMGPNFFSEGIFQVIFFLIVSPFVNLYIAAIGIAIMWPDILSHFFISFVLNYNNNKYFLDDFDQNKIIPNKYCFNKKNIFLILKKSFLFVIFYALLFILIHFLENILGYANFDFSFKLGFIFKYIFNFFSSSNDGSYSAHLAYGQGVIISLLFIAALIKLFILLCQGVKNFIQRTRI